MILDLAANLDFYRNLGIGDRYAKAVDFLKSHDLKTLEKMRKFAIIMGNEGNGVKKELLDMCDEYIYIKMNESCESLNVAVATSIILYELDK